MGQQAEWHFYHVTNHLVLYSWKTPPCTRQRGLLLNPTKNAHPEMEQHFHNRFRCLWVLAWPKRYYVWAWIENKPATFLHSVSLTKQHEFSSQGCCIFSKKGVGYSYIPSSVTGRQELVTGLPTCSRLTPTLLLWPQHPGLSSYSSRLRTCISIAGSALPVRVQAAADRSCKHKHNT